MTRALPNQGDDPAGWIEVPQVLREFPALRQTWVYERIHSGDWDGFVCFAGRKPLVYKPRLLEWMARGGDRPCRGVSSESRAPSIGSPEYAARVGHRSIGARTLQTVEPPSESPNATNVTPSFRVPRSRSRGH